MRLLDEVIFDSPVAGHLIPLSEVRDEVFSEKILGHGVAVSEPSNEVRAPFDGRISILFHTKHAIGVYSDKGVSLLIHVGIDTVQLAGRYFKAYVKKGEHVKKGQLLLRFDAKAIREAGYDITTPIIVTNFADYARVVVRSGAEMLPCQ